MTKKCLMVREVFPSDVGQEERMQQMIEIVLYLNDIDFVAHVDLKESILDG